MDDPECNEDADLPQMTCFMMIISTVEGTVNDRISKF